MSQECQFLTEWKNHQRTMFLVLNKVVGAEMVGTSETTSPKGVGMWDQ